MRSQLLVVGSIGVEPERGVLGSDEESSSCDRKEHHHARAATRKSAAQSHRGRWFAGVLAVVAALTLSLGPANTPLAPNEAQAKPKLGIAVGLAAGYVLGTKAGHERHVPSR